MKLALLTFGFLVACGGADSPLLDQASSTTPSTDPVAVDDASAETSTPVTLPEFDGGSPVEDAATEDAATSTCAGYADPTSAGTCHACTGSTCQPNGCFGGWYCKLDTQKCVTKPSGC